MIHSSISKWLQFQGSGAVQAHSLKRLTETLNGFTAVPFLLSQVRSVCHEEALLKLIAGEERIRVNRVGCDSGTEYRYRSDRSLRVLKMINKVCSTVAGYGLYRVVRAADGLNTSALFLFNSLKGSLMHLVIALKPKI